MIFEQISSEVRFVAVRSRGPGGQNVNKVSSASLLLWSFETSLGLTDAEKAEVRRNLSSYINTDNEVFLRSDEFRDLGKNKSRCLEKLEALLEKAFFKAKPRKASKPTRSSKLKKLESKRRRGDIKRSRQGRWD